MKNTNINTEEVAEVDYNRMLGGADNIPPQPSLTLARKKFADLFQNEADVVAALEQIDAFCQGRIHDAEQVRNGARMPDGEAEAGQADVDRWTEAQTTSLRCRYEVCRAAGI